jgi:hypothetical protein
MESNEWSACRAIAAAALLSAAGGAAAQVLEGRTAEIRRPDSEHFLPEIRAVSFDAPTKDTSTYSNIGASANTRPFVWMSTFPGEGRQSNLVTMFDTASAGVPTGLDARRVLVAEMTFTACTYPSGPRAVYDPDPDPWQNTLWAGGDIIIYNFFGGTIPVGTESVPAEPRYISLGPQEDGNKPVELFGVRFNNEWTAATWVESGFGTPGFQNGVYNAEPIDFDANGLERPVLNSMGETAVEFVLGDYVGDDGQTYDTYYPTGNFLPDPVDGFDPSPFALGASFDIPDGTPGHSIAGQGQQAITLGDELPPGHRLRFEVRVDDPAVQGYLRGQFEGGWLSLMASQLAYADIGLNGTYSYWLTKEGSATLPPVFDLDASTLDFTYLYVPPGDFDGDGLIAPGDEDAALVALTDPIAFKRAYPLLDARTLTDMDGDGDTDLADLAAIVSMIAEVRSGAQAGAIGG